MDHNKRRKILYFIPEFPRITETFIEREVSKLIDLGNLDIKVFSMQKASGLLSDNVIGSVVYRRLNLFYFVKSFSYLFTNPIGVLNSFVVVIKDTTKPFIKRIYLFFKALGYSKMFEEYKPDIIHAHFLADPSTIALVASKVIGIPYSISAHAKDVFVEGTLIPQKIQTAKFISICNGYAYKKCLEIANVDFAPNVCLIYHGVDHKKIFSQPPKLIKPAKPVILNVSRLVEKKGVDYLIQASKILVEKGIDHELDIVAGGPLYSKYIDMIKDLNLENTVFIRGDGKGLPFDKNVEYFKIADIFAFPGIVTSEGDVDGVPTVIIEAALLGIPVVTTDVGGITDLINSERGIIIPEKNAEALANALELLINDPATGKEYTKKAYIAAAEMFDIDKNLKQLEKHFL